jgi:hypothetical protein
MAFRDIYDGQLLGTPGCAPGPVSFKPKLSDRTTQRLVSVTFWTRPDGPFRGPPSVLFPKHVWFDFNIPCDQAELRYFQTSRTAARIGP